MKIHLILDTTDNENLDQQRSRSFFVQKDSNHVSRSYNSFYSNQNFDGIFVTSSRVLDWCTIQTLKEHRVS